MARFYCGKVHSSDGKLWYYMLAVSWLSGLLCGILFFLYSKALTVSLMHRNLFTSVSIVGLFSIYVIPFLFTAFAVFISRLWLLIPISFLKAFLYGFASMWICAGFGSAGWLVCMIAMFSDSICVVMLFFLWIRLLSGQNRKCLVETVLSGTVFIWAGFFDYYIISPFLAGLIEI